MDRHQVSITMVVCITDINILNLGLSAIPGVRCHRCPWITWPRHPFKCSIISTTKIISRSEETNLIKVNKTLAQNSLRKRTTSNYLILIKKASCRDLFLMPRYSSLQTNSKRRATNPIHAAFHPPMTLLSLQRQSPLSQQLWNNMQQQKMIISTKNLSSATWLTRVENPMKGFLR